MIPATPTAEELLQTEVTQKKPTTRPAGPGAIPARLAQAVRRQKEYAQKFREAHIDKVAGDLELCTTNETLVLCHSCGGRWWVPHRCKLRVCPVCSYRKMREREDYIMALCAKMKFPKLITLTMPRWKEDPREGIAFIRARFNELREHAVFENVRGGAYQIELKQKEDGWHIHIHALVDSPYIPYQHLFSAWRSILHLPAVQVDIRAAKDANQQKYVAKYCSKAADYDGQTDVVAWYKATLGIRLWATFGEWYNAKLEDLLNETEDQKPGNVCPHCGDTGTAFFARDGPFIFGGKDWNAIKGAWIGNNEAITRMEKNWKELLGNE